MPEPYAHENTIYGSYGEFIPVPEDVDWNAHNAEADAYFKAEDERRAADMWE